MYRFSYSAIWVLRNIWVVPFLQAEASFVLISDFFKHTGSVQQADAAF